VSEPNAAGETACGNFCIWVDHTAQGPTKVAGSAVRKDGK